MVDFVFVYDMWSVSNKLILISMLLKLQPPCVSVEAPCYETNEHDDSSDAIPARKNNEPDCIIGPLSYRNLNARLKRSFSQ